MLFKLRAKELFRKNFFDKEIRVLDPRHTKLVPDIDYGYRKTKLFIENQIRNASATPACRGSSNGLRHRYDPVYQKQESASSRLCH